jgi:hypothetical protein
MQVFRVLIPEENYTIITFNRENLPAIMVINSSLLQFEPKEVFDWHLSLIIDFETEIENGMPAQSETDVTLPFEKYIDTQLKGEEDKPNALFFGRITWNGTRELIYKICNPEIANETLQKIIDDKTYPREFDYVMKFDKNWELHKKHLEAVKPNIVLKILQRLKNAWFKSKKTNTQINK